MLGFTPLAAVAFADTLNPGNIIVQVVGVYGTGQIGTVTVLTQQNIAVTGVQGTGQIGTVIINAGGNVYVTGVYATGYIGYPTMWGLVNDAQTSIWTPVIT